MKTALFLNPPSGLYRRDDRCQCKVDDQTVRVVFEPIELALYAANLERLGWRCAIRDYPAMYKTWQDFDNDLKSLQPELVVFVGTTATIQADLQVPELVKEHLPETLVIGKGETLGLWGKDILRQHEHLDAIFIGEPDLTIQEIGEGKSWREIDGLLLRDDNGEPVKRERRDYITDLDSLPRPARHLLEHSLYTSPETGKPMAVIHTQRGCPAKCTFCNIGNVYGAKIRTRSVEHVCEEIESAVRENGIREFLFHGDTFTYKRKWVIELCEEIVRRNLNIRWGCNSRVDSIDDERLAIMKQAGCWVIAFGIETGSQKILDSIKKGATVEQAREAVALVKKHGIRVQAFMIIGTPEENWDTLAMTEKFLREIDPDFFDLNVAYPLPGTQYYKEGKLQGYFDEHRLPFGSYATAATRSRYLSAEELTTWRKKALMRLTLRPKYIFRTLWHAKSPNKIFHYVKAGLFRLKSLREA